MLDQKEVIQKIYLELVNDNDWIKKYKENPDKVISSYGLTDENSLMMKRILGLF